MNDGLKDQQRNAILEVLNQHPKIERAVLFGSRAMGTFTPTSDIDIALYGDLTLRDQARIADELERLSIPYTVDLVRMKTVTSPELLAHIKEHGREWKLAEANIAPSECVQLRDVCVKIGSGATPRGGKEAYKGGDTSLIRSQNVYNEGFHREGLVYIDDDQAAELRNVEVKESDVLLNITGDSVARCCQVAKDVLPARVNQHVAIIRPEPKVLDARFLRYVLVSHEYQSRLLALASAGATRPALTKSMIEGLKVPSPPLAEQKAIAAVLGALDDKIELNRRMNATLEAMARALFQSWFVDFDPVRAKLDGRPPTALDPATSALFPEHFEDSPLGHIPKGWKAQRLPDAIEVNPRRTLKKGTIAPYLDMKNLPTQGHSAEEVIDREFSSGTKFQNGDSLLARITPCLENGKTGYVDFLEDGQVGWGSTEYIVLAPKPPLPPQFGYFLVRSDALRTHAIQNMTGTSGRQRVPAECFHAFRLAVPPPAIAKRFDELTAPLMAKIKANSTESRTLATLRDTLLPKLLSGELSVAEVEKEVLA